MKRTVPKLTTDEEAEAFLARDLSELDFSKFKPTRFDIEEPAQLSLRLPRPLLDAVKERARERGVPYARFVREALELALRQG